MKFTLSPCRRESIGIYGFLMGHLPPFLVFDSFSRVARAWFILKFIAQRTVRDTAFNLHTYINCWADGRERDISFWFSLFCSQALKSASVCRRKQLSSIYNGMNTVSCIVFSNETGDCTILLLNREEFSLYIINKLFVQYISPLSLARARGERISRDIHIRFILLHLSLHTFFLPEACNNFLILTTLLTSGNSVSVRRRTVYRILRLLQLYHGDSAHSLNLWREHLKCVGGEPALPVLPPGKRVERGTVIAQNLLPSLTPDSLFWIRKETAIEGRNVKETPAKWTKVSAEILSVLIT